MGFITGQQVLFMGEPLWMLADFVQNDEGWHMLRFSDESTATVRPSHVRPLNERTCEIVMEEYASQIGKDPLKAVSLGVLVDRVADAIRYPHMNRIEKLHAAEVQSVRG